MDVFKMLLLSDQWFKTQRYLIYSDVKEGNLRCSTNNQLIICWSTNQLNITALNGHFLKWIYCWIYYIFCYYSVTSWTVKIQNWYDMHFINCNSWLYKMTYTYIVFSLIAKESSQNNNSMCGSCRNISGWQQMFIAQNSEHQKHLEASTSGEQHIWTVGGNTPFI